MAKETLLEWLQVAAEKDKICAVLIDTAGPQIHTCALVDHPETMKPVKSIMLERGEHVVLVAYDPAGSDPFVGWKIPSETRILVNFIDLVEQARPGMLILIDDGNIRLEITDVASSHVTAKVLSDAELCPRQGFNMLGISADMPVLTTRDRNDLELAVEYGVDAVAASYVKSAEDITYVKDLLTELGGADIKVCLGS